MSRRLRFDLDTALLRSFAAAVGNGNFTRAATASLAVTFPFDLRPYWLPSTRLA